MVALSLLNALIEVLESKVGVEIIGESTCGINGVSATVTQTAGGGSGTT